MYMHLVLMLAASSILFEAFLAYRIMWFRHFMEKNEYAAIIFSVMLSIMLGTAFGAEGLVTLTAGIMSTAASPIMYKVLRYWFDHEAEMHAHVERGKELAHDLTKVMIFTAKVVTFPLWGPRRVVTFFKDLKDKPHDWAKERAEIADVLHESAA